MPIAKLKFANTRPKVALLGYFNPRGTRGVNSAVRERVSDPVHLDVFILKSEEDEDPANRDRTRERGRRHVVVFRPPWQESTVMTRAEPVSGTVTVVMGARDE